MLFGVYSRFTFMPTAGKICKQSISFTLTVSLIKVERVDDVTHYLVQIEEPKKDRRVTTSETVALVPDSGDSSTEVYGRCKTAN